MQKLQTKAKKFGVFNSPSTGSIIYVDPKHSSADHHSPMLTDAEAREAFMRGLIEDPAEARKKDTDALEPFEDENALATVATALVADTAKIEAEATGAPSTLDSRQTTAFSDGDRVRGPAEGAASGIDADSGDADAPPATPPATGRTRKPATPRA